MRLGSVNRLGLCVAAGLLASGGCSSNRGDGSGDSGAESSLTNVDTSGSGSASATDDASGTAGETQGEASASAEGGVKFDVGGEETEGETEGVGCECGSQLGFSYIWIANSTQSTVTKLNTQTMAEEGRFLTRADGAGNPSRTSVTIDGRAVAVANRAGGVTKVWAKSQYCDETKNGMAGLQTSTDINFLPWGQDDCIAWDTPFAYNTQRPVAWSAGTLNHTTCEYENQKLWTAGCNYPGDQWAIVSRLNGDTGMIEDQITMNGFECSSLSPYGGAVDANGNFWFTNLVPGQDRLGFVDAQTLAPQVYTMPITPYGMTVDSKGRPWIASWTGSQNVSGARFDPMTQQWDFAVGSVANVMSGIQEDAFGRMWMNYWTYDGDGTDPGLTYIDSETMQVGPAFGIGCPAYTCRGISIDLDGNVWSTGMSANTAYRFDPDTQQVDTYTQLQGPYTYSDMTGWALQNASCAPEG